ncbi:MAG: methyltransferase [Porticoccaceae bacterium]
MAGQYSLGDAGVTLLMEQWQSDATLIAADENWADAQWSRGHSATVISNRCDIASAAEHAGLNVLFNDFDFSPLAGQLFDCALLRLPKERPLCHHLINQLFDTLQPDATVWFCGAKNDGIKTTFNRAVERFGGATAVVSKLKKHGSLYLGAVRKDNSAGSVLDDQDYPQLRSLAADPHWQSKPGIFGWQKIDRGSELLLQNWQRLISEGQLAAPERLLDLGCGYGYLGISAGAWLAEREHSCELILTDNSATALLAARANLDRLPDLLREPSQLLAADSGRDIEGRFELILCNPPFHQGFSVDGRLTEKFIAATRRLLKPGGAALFVVNEFIPLERAAEQQLWVCEIERREGFRILQLELPA